MGASSSAVWAAQTGGHEIARALISAGAAIDAPNDYGITPLLHASRIGDATMVELYLGANILVLGGLTAVATTLATTVLGRMSAPGTQNFVVGGFEAPQEEQSLASAAPHSPQNLRPSSFSVEHCGHLTV